MFALDSLSMSMARWFAETTLVASALALVAYVVARWRGPSPAIRHVLWLVVLVRLMTPPVVHWPWSRPFLAPSPASRPIALASTFEAPSEEIASSTTPLEGPRVPEREGPRAGIAAHRDGLEAAGPIGTGPAAWFVCAWLIGSVALGGEQLARIIRFRRQIRGGTAAPAWLVAEAEEIGRRMSVRVPAIRVVERLGTPLLWCLGRPVLLVPAGLLESLEPGRWRAILAHELAHLRRGDPWVGRLELVALVVWWWNPLYWLARRRIDFEAELACDSWVLWTFPEGRIEYAESLVRICAIPRSAGSPAPALGVSGAGRSFERRLIMVLRGQASQADAPLPVLLAATLLAALALPSWTLGAIEEAQPNLPLVVSIKTPVSVPLALDDDDDDDDDDKEKLAKQAKADKAKADKKAKADRESSPLIDTLDREALQKKLEALGEQMGKQIEAKFGPEFERKMEALGKEIEEKFGPEFEKKMEALGKEVEKQFGPGSDFARQMKQLGEQMAKEFGAGSDFEPKVKFDVKIMSDDAKVKADGFKVKSDKAKIKSDEINEKSDEDKIKFYEARGKADEAKVKARAEANKARAEAAKVRAEDAKNRSSARMKSARDKSDAESSAKAKAKPGADKEKRSRRIESLESRIDEMMKELKLLKADENGRDEDKDDDEEDKDED